MYSFYCVYYFVYTFIVCILLCDEARLGPFPDQMVDLVLDTTIFSSYLCKAIL